jgi:hypothetical protein
LFDERQIKIILFEDFKHNVVGVMQELYSFLAVDTQFIPDISVQYNAGGVPKSQARQNIINYLRRLKPLRFYLPTGLRTAYTNAARANLAPAATMPSEARMLLAELYRDDVAKLQNLIHKDLTIWELN